MNPRTCIVTRTEKRPEQMIRFVLGPENKVYPDIKRKLPGRGVWITARHNLVEEALREGLFARGFKSKVQSDPELPDVVEQLLAGSALETVSLAKKAGLLVPGQANAELAVRSGEAGLLLMALDASEGGKRKMEFATRSMELHHDIGVPVFRRFTSDELDKAIGSVNVMHLAVLSGSIADKLVTQLNRLIHYRDLDAEKAD